MKAKPPDLAQCLQRFFREHLSVQRNVSSATIAAYADTFRLLFRYLKTRRGRAPLSLEVLKPETILGFLDYLEQKRGHGTRTRNARLAAIRSFIHYLNDCFGPALPSTV